jgi:hypothetical protein
MSEQSDHMSWHYGGVLGIISLGSKRNFDELLLIVGYTPITLTDYLWYAEYDDCHGPANSDL